MSIPIAYDKENNIIKIPEDQLPVKLPENINLNTNGNPLDAQNEWKNVIINKNKCVRETDTLDTFGLFVVFFKIVHLIIKKNHLMK